MTTTCSSAHAACLIVLVSAGLLMCLLPASTVAQNIQRPETRSDAQVRCEQKLGEGAVAEEELDFGEVSYICDCRGSYKWNDGNTRCVSAQSSQSSTSNTDKPVAAAPFHDCDRLAAHPDDEDKLAAGVGIQEIQVDEAVKACRLALESFPNSTRLEFQLARALDAGDKSVEAVLRYRKVANKGQIYAMSNLAFMYRTGKGVGKSYKEAMQWYRKAADKGHVYSMYHLGRMYQEGTGITKSHKEAAHWYRKAADKGNAFSMYALAIFYDGGIFFKPDPDRAAQLTFDSLREKKTSEPIIEHLTLKSTPWTRKFRRALQRRLKDAGAYNGKIDGSFGPATRRAIAKLPG